MSKQSQQNIISEEKKTCFVIMPISDHPDYTVGHFNRIYEHIIKPACTKAGFIADRADDAQHTHVIMMNILQRILDADMVLCDLSTKNPNVLYELGIRQAFDKPVTLIKDERTTRIFDTGMLSDVEYISDLRIDNVQQAVDDIATRIKNTYEKKDNQVNSLIQLMKIQPAKMPTPTTISTDTTVILDAIAMLGQRISTLEIQRGERIHRTKNEYFAASPRFSVSLQNKNKEVIDNFISAFDKFYPINSVLRQEEKDEFTIIEFEFEKPVSINHSILQRVGDMTGIKIMSSSVFRA